MIVRDFLDWVRTAPASQRAEATSALARAYLYSDLSPDDAAAAEGAMLMLLDDRFAAGAPRARRRAGGKPERAAGDHAGAAADQPQIAAPVLALSPLLVDADLVDAVATGGGAVQAAVASRAALPRSVAAAIAEVGSGGILPGAAGKCRRRHRAILDRPDRRTARPSCRDPRGVAGARRCRGGDAADAGRQAVGHLGRLRRRAAMARCRSRAAHRARGMREGDPGAGRRSADARRCGRWFIICASPVSSPPGSILRALLSRQYRACSKKLWRSCRHAGRAGFRPRP